MVAYLRELNAPRLLLWCYLIWYLFTVACTFDASPRLWLTSLGISGIIGAGLYLSTARAGKEPVSLGRWQVFRLFLMPFCVSSFAALIRGRGFVLVFHPTLRANALGSMLCLAFLVVVWAFKQPRPAAVGSRAAPETPTPTPSTARGRCSTAR
jgi:hypothetical protein